MKKFLQTFIYTETELLKRSTSSINHTICTLSGGQDSLLSFFVLLAIRKKQNFKVLYCHHFWQQQNFYCSAFIFQLSFLFEVPYLLSLPTYFILNENRARVWRKKVFNRISQGENNSQIITGQNQTDSLEKNLNNLFRGTTVKKSNPALQTQSITKRSFSWFPLKTSLFVFKSILIQQKFIFLFVVEFQDFLKIELSGKQKSKRKKIRRKFFQFIKKKKEINEKKKEKFFTLTTLLVFDQLTNKKVNFNRFSLSLLFSTRKLDPKVFYYKPLIKIRRRTISKFINFYNLPLLNDVTNFSSSLSRNKIRQQVFPFLRIIANKKVESLITQFFRTFEQDEQENNEIYSLCTIYQKKFDQAPIIQNFTIEEIIRTSLLTQPKKFSTILHNLFFDYQEIELTFVQILRVKTLIF